jgi:hypothetical protein
MNHSEMMKKIEQGDGFIAALEDPSGLFNSSLSGGTRRAIDIPEGGDVDEQAFKALIREAVALNLARKKR